MLIEGTFNSEFLSLFSERPSNWISNQSKICSSKWTNTCLSEFQASIDRSEKLRVSVAAAAELLCIAALSPFLFYSLTERLPHNKCASFHVYILHTSKCLLTRIFSHFLYTYPFRQVPTEKLSQHWWLNFIMLHSFTTLIIPITIYINSGFPLQL